MRRSSIVLRVIGVAGTVLRATRTRVGVRGLSALCVLAGTGIVSSTAGAGGATAQAPQLPDEVRAWLEMDQVQRWAAMIQEGKALFDEGSCTRCHGEGGSGGQWGPDLTDGEWVQSDGSLEGIREVIFWGVRRRDFSDTSRRFEMNPAGGMTLEWDEVRALAAYVWSLQNGDFLPRR